KQNPAAPAVRDDAVYIPTSPNPVPALAHFCQVQVGHSSLAPKDKFLLFHNRGHKTGNQFLKLFLFPISSPLLLLRRS
ncbi:MAG: hypothetical protein ACYCOR_21830, partial [Acidobacteriaceae bacterium]